MPTRLPEWMDEARRSPRWRDVCTVLAQGPAEEENLGKSIDFSETGAAIRFERPPLPGPGLLWRFSVVFERGVRTLTGRVVYVRPDGRIGVQWEGISNDDLSFLRARYSSGTRRKVT